MRAVLVKWVDSFHASGGWHTRGPEIQWDEDEMTCHTVGFMLRETEYSYELAQSYNYAEVGGVFAIPKVAVKEIRDVG